MTTELSQFKNEANSIVLASRFKRFVASLINVVLLWIILILAIYLGGSDSNTYEQSQTLLPISGFIGLGLYLIFQLYLVHKKAQSIGKYLMGIKVVNYVTLQNISVWHYILREILEQIFAITSILSLVSAITAFCNKERRSLTDMIVGTLVIKA